MCITFASAVLLPELLLQIAPIKVYQQGKIASWLIILKEKNGVFEDCLKCHKYEIGLIRNVLTKLKVPE